jgi:hypothetical protein
MGLKGGFINNCAHLRQVLGVILDHYVTVS